MDVLVANVLIHTITRLFILKPFCVCCFYDLQITEFFLENVILHDLCFSGGLLPKKN